MNDTTTPTTDDARDAARLRALLADPGPLWAACYRQIGSTGGDQPTQAERIRAVIDAALGS